MADWKTLSSEVVYESPWIKVHKDAVANGNGTELTYSYMSLPHPSVIIVATNSAGDILLQRGYRYPLKQTLWEVPAGHSEGQEPLEAAKRELLEEAGLESDTWVALGETYLAGGVARIHQLFFLAENARSVTDERDKEEDISEQQFIPITKVKEMLQNGDIIGGGAQIALYKYILRKENA